MKRRAKHSTARDPFSSFREYADSPSVNEHVLAGTPWTSPPCHSYFVFWQDIAPAIEGVNYGMPQVLSKLYSDSEIPLVSVLVSLALNSFKFLQQVHAAPTQSELREQLSAIRRQLEGLASLAQGGRPHGISKSNPAWLTASAETEQDATVEQFIRHASRRRVSLHPILQDLLSEAMYAGEAMEVDEFATRVNEARHFSEQETVFSFFDSITAVRDLVQKAEQLCIGETALPNLKERSLGAPGDEALNWLMTRLLWIWRDVLGEEIRIYARKIENGIELQELKPNDCMTFVLTVLDSVDPVRPHKIPALERKLTALKELVPSTPLAILTLSNE